MSTTTTPTVTIPGLVSLEEHSPSYKLLLDKLRTINDLNNAASCLNYDRQVYMSPTSDGASASRGRQLATLASMSHELSISPEIGSLIEKATQDLNNLSIENANLGDAKRILELEGNDYKKRVCIPSELAARKAELEAKANSAWVKARQNNDFASFAPLLKECFDTASEIASLQLHGSEISLYSQMLDEFEMGMPAERIDTLFEEVQCALVPLIAKIRTAATATANAPSLLAPLTGRKFNINAQKEACQRIVTALGYDINRGKIDVSVHPFTMSLSSGGHDVRITSRFSEDDWYQGLMGTIHEGGHAIYEQNLPSGGNNLNIDTALSMGVHESQSLFWERHVGKTREFYTWIRPILMDAFHNSDDGKEFAYTPEELYAAVNTVDFTNLIRVDADELTYPLHVILRYGIERDVISGKIDVNGIPNRWNSDMKTFLDIHVPDDTRGCLQDIHWSFLAIGYFPTYLLGAIMAAQLAYYCEKDIPDMYDMIKVGKFDDIRGWLTRKVHVHGKRYKSLDDLLIAEVGEPLNTKYFIDYLTKKYTDLYKI